MTDYLATIPQAAHQANQQEWEQTVSTGGVAYDERGAGPPILFLHGIGGGARHFGGQLAHFAPTHRAIAWDMPGYGRSTPLPIVTIDALAGALAAFIDELALDRPIILGHSLGGMVLQRFLALRPHGARAAILSQTSAAFGSRDPAWEERFIHHHLAPLDAGQDLASLAAALVEQSTAPGADPAGLAVARDCMAATPTATYRDNLLALRGFDARAGLPHIAVPTLLVAGAQDTAAPPAGMERMAARIPGATLAVLEGCGHLAHLEQPVAFNEILAIFLRAMNACMPGETNGPGGDTP